MEPRGREGTPRSSGAARLTARIGGYVQGVGYRWFARQRAQALGLTGYARNEPDGSVVVVAEGPRPLLESFLADLRRGPEGADVQTAGESWDEATGEFSNFQIRH
jgi:acylphosphatase